MDGFKGRLNESIQLKLSVSLLLAILVVGTVAGVFSFMSAFDEAHELQDDTLRQIAALFNRQPLPSAFPGGYNHAEGDDEESRVVVQYLADGKETGRIMNGRRPLPLPATLHDGLHTLEVDGEPFRVLIKTTAGGDRIAVAQETGIRNEIARDSALRTLMPLLILVPVLLLIVAKLVREMFRPISVLSKEIDQRAEQELHSVDEFHLPVEIRPFVVAINRLLARVARSMDAQRRFVADAAHELRSPLTAMSLQAERLSKSEMSDPARERLLALHKGIERARNLMDQLLTLAKAQSAPDSPRSAVSVQSVYRHVLEDVMPLAETKHIDIGVEGEQAGHVLVNEFDLIAIVKNLVDNAIRYTPEGGRVDLSTSFEDGSVVLQIKDSGPGIPTSERNRVFDRFYRTLGSDQAGSGLGLSIVKAIADRIGAEILLAFSDEAKQSGLCVSVVLPSAKWSRSV